MFKTDAIDLATKISLVLLAGARRTGNRPTSNQSLMASASIMRALSERDVAGLDPTIHEIVLFGSTARADGADEVGDVDIMIFDRGFYSKIMPAGYNKKKNLQLLLGDFFEYHSESHVFRLASENQVDLLALPIALFTDSATRNELAGKQRDPQFFQNAFKHMMRFDRDQGAFIPVSEAEMRQRAAATQL